MPLLHFAQNGVENVLGGFLIWGGGPYSNVADKAQEILFVLLQFVDFALQSLNLLLPKSFHFLVKLIYRFVWFFSSRL